LVLWGFKLEWTRYIGRSPLLPGVEGSHVDWVRHKLCLLSRWLLLIQHSLLLSCRVPVLSMKVLVCHTRHDGDGSREARELHSWTARCIEEEPVSSLLGI